MKKSAILLVMCLLSGRAGTMNAAEDASPSPAPDVAVELKAPGTQPDGAPPDIAPASVEKIKQKIEAMNTQPPSGVEGVVKMVEAGVDSKVVETYIRNSRIPSPTPRDLIYMHDKGIPQDLVNALIENGRQVREQAAAQAAQNKKSHNTTASTAAPAVQPAVTVVPSEPQYQYVTTAPAVTYSVPTYSYPDPNYPLVYPAAPKTSSLIIIPYRPYRSYYQSYYSAPFYDACNPWYGSSLVAGSYWWHSRPYPMNYYGWGWSPYWGRGPYYAHHRF